MIQLETYKGTKTRHNCPACNRKNEFTRFVDDAGNYIADDMGICNRISECGYRYTAKQYFADNPTAKNGRGGQSAKGKKRSISNYGFADAADTRDLSDKKCPIALTSSRRNI